jgi:hypothetical protein
MAWAEYGAEGHSVTDLGGTLASTAVSRRVSRLSSAFDGGIAGGTLDSSGRVSMLDNDFSFGSSAIGGEEGESGFEEVRSACDGRGPFGEIEVDGGLRRRKEE